MPLSQPERHEDELQNNDTLLNGLFVDPGTRRRLEELCCAMTDSCGVITATLELALENEDRRATYVNTALTLSFEAIKSVKMFLSEWHVLTAESEMDNARRAALFLKNLSLAETERRAIIHAVKQAGGNPTAASRLLRVGASTVYRKLKEYACDSSQVSQDHPAAPDNLRDELSGRLGPAS